MQEALHAGAQDRRAREVQGAFDQADQEYRVRMAKAASDSSYYKAAAAFRQERDGQ